MMKKKRISFMVFLFLSVLMINCSLPVSFAKAASNTAEITHIYDAAGVLSESQIEDLESLALEYGKKQDLNYLVVFNNYIEGVEVPANEDMRRKGTIQASEQFYKDFVATYGEKEKDCAILYVFYPGVKGQNYADVSGQGAIREKLDNSRADQVFNKIASSLGNGNLYDACVNYMKTVDRYIKVLPGVNPELFILKLPFQLLIGLIIAVIIVLIMVHNSGGKITVTQNTYLDAKSPGVIGRYDRFVRTTTTSRKIQSSSSGSGGGGSSGGSGSHGGGSF